MLNMKSRPPAASLDFECAHVSKFCNFHRPCSSCLYGAKHSEHSQWVISSAEAHAHPGSCSPSPDNGGTARGPVCCSRSLDKKMAQLYRAARDWQVT